MTNIIAVDANEGQVVRAESEQQARSLCYVADEGPIWTDPNLVTCELLAENVRGKAGVVLCSHHAG